MYSLFESFRSALQSIRAHSFRSFLTALGIIIGVASVVAVISVVQGLSHSISNEFKGLGSNSLTVRAYTSLDEALKGKVNRMSLDDFALLRDRLTDVDSMSPSFTPFGDFGTNVRKGTTSAFSAVFAVTEIYQDAHQSYPQYGRFISESDNLSRRRVVVIGTKLRDNLNLPENPIGEFLEIGGEWFKIIGVTEPRGEMLGISKDDYALIPFSVGELMLSDPALVNIAVTFNVDRVESLEAAQGRVVALLRQQHKLKPGQRDDFKVQTSQELTETFSKILDSVTYVLGGVVSVSLLVGGIGIMNIMLVSVTERTREIGISKALGAQRHHILMQFLIEATVLSFIGGVIGILVGYALGLFAAVMIPGFPGAVVPWWAIALSFGFSTLVGVLFGILPAAKAANLDPIVALRFE